MGKISSLIMMLCRWKELWIHGILF